MAAFTTIDDPSVYFQIATWTGNTSAPRSITNDGNSDMQPDWVWGKNRTTAGTDHEIYDSNRGTGVNFNLKSSSSGAEGVGTTYGQLTSFDTDGFTVNAGGTNDDFWNENGSEFVAWQWKAGGGTTASNSDGSITSTVQANTTAGFSIITYTGTGGNETFGHGLGVAPDMWIIKRRNGTGSWAVGFNDSDVLGGTSKYLILQSDAAVSTYLNFFGTSAASSTVMRIAGDATIGGSSNTYVAYAFAQKQGFSKFGAYEGTGQRDGVFVYLGFQPAFVMIKNIDGSGRWTMFDNKRTIANGDFEYLVADDDHAESDTGLGFTDPIDFLSNGFKQKNSDAFTNGSSTYMYWAWAEHPFVTSTGIPTTAR